MKKQIRTPAIAITRNYPTNSFSFGDHLDGAQPSVSELSARSRRGLWNFILFLLISMAALSAQNFNFFAAVPEDLWMILGSPPPPQFIHLSLAIYIFCALALLPGRLNKASLAQSWAHLGYRTIFYFFYLTANVLADNFIVVFAVGLLLYLLEQSYLFLQMFKIMPGTNPQTNGRE